MDRQLLAEIFNSPEALKELPQIFEHTHQYKIQLDHEIKSSISDYVKVDIHQEVVELATLLRDTKNESQVIQTSISNMTLSIQQLDQTKKNLVLSMTVLKRLQMLIKTHEELQQVIASHNYKEIYQLFGAAKELLTYFKPYKSIDEINQMNMSVIKTQLKLIDDIFVDFDMTINTNKSRSTQSPDQGELSQSGDDNRSNLSYGCLILEVIDVRLKDKLLSWFYDSQLLEVKAIFNSQDEAGSLENLNRRYIFFLNNVLRKVQSQYSKYFPEEWNVDFELTRIFCDLTRSSVEELLRRNPSSSSRPSSAPTMATEKSTDTLLDGLLSTIDFEKTLNERFPDSGNDFSSAILKVFEPYLKRFWIREQDKLLSGKLNEFMASPLLPPEFEGNDLEQFIGVLKINNVPNISNSSIELFKIFTKSLGQILKLSNGEILIDLSLLFKKYLMDYHDRFLIPVIEGANTNSSGIEPIKYLTLLINTSDYIINNIDDLEDRLSSVIRTELKAKISFESVKDAYYQVIQSSQNSLLGKFNSDLQFAWRLFGNTNWSNEVSDVSPYMNDFIKTTTNNIRVTLPMIIRDGYVRNLCDRVVDLAVYSFQNKLKLIKPMSLATIEQILMDISTLKKSSLLFTLYSNPNFDGILSTDESDNNSKFKINKNYEKYVNNQFNKIEILLKLLMTPSDPCENIVEAYFELIGDKSIHNFIKILELKNIKPQEQSSYIETFNLQLTTGDSDLLDESPILVKLEGSDPLPLPKASSTSTSSAFPSENRSTPSPFGSIRSTLLGSPSLGISKSKSPDLNNTINNIEKNLRGLALSSETKFNENIKSFGKLFRKEAQS
ncbi:Vacuolar protein sorting-associated protein 53 [Scheffersomyces spartinae]|uniref:Vacuolar protein sorting-associated protein 53 n=1 Tax=Scheffersomyces spartinae TaxID=45513 RepID=A0A9P8AJF7_9ASCO|nr:Vacuolar protein sorting-associated protein 53 [Scheffersomyces spartinae]KAG7194716.1 Vacuolar protein sorting-associated protein 53 [Scheffersomyces spartinae]